MVHLGLTASVICAGGTAECDKQANSQYVVNDNDNNNVGGTQLTLREFFDLNAQARTGRLPERR